MKDDLTTRQEKEATERFVIQYLKQHPDLLQKNPELLEVIALPEKAHGGGVIDFQHFALSRLQQDLKKTRESQETVLAAARDNLSTQSQVMKAALQLIKAKDLEQLLAALTQDLMELFRVDVVRLAVESEIAGSYETFYGEQNYSGITFVMPGTVDAALGKKNALLVVNADTQPVAGFEEIFAECERLVHSCALLKLHLELSRRHAILAFGVRDVGRFHNGQAVDLLCFLAHIVEYKLDTCLTEMTP